MSYDFSFREAANRSNAGFSFLFGTCDVGEGNHLGCTNLGSLHAIHRTRGFLEEANRSGVITIGEIYRLRLVHDGKAELQVYVDGELVNQVSCGPLLGGRWFLWTHTSWPVAVRQIEFEGTIDPASLKKARQKWVDARLANLGGTGGE